MVEAAGFDVVLVETVGVGQSETAVAEMVDLFVLLISPGGGGDLQGIKRGVMELADLVLVTKADGDLATAASRAAADYQAALHLMRPKYRELLPHVLKVSAVEGRGIAEAWEAMLFFHQALVAGGHLKALREDQLRHWFWSEVEAVLRDEIGSEGQSAALASDLEASVVGGRTLSHVAARTLIKEFRRP